jgi:dTDP-4-dehydrorhamnose reductase
MRDIAKHHAVEPPLPLLVTGVAGVAGYNAFHYFRRKYGPRVIGIRRKDNWPLRGEGIIACDGDDRETLSRLFDKHQFAAVLNCEGTCKLKSCELNPKMAERVNIDSVTTLLDIIRDTTTRLVHLSIDLVYSGTRGGGHVEEDATDPVTVYGKTMAEAEQIILRESSIRQVEQKETEKTEEGKEEPNASCRNDTRLSPPLPPFPPVQYNPRTMSRDRCGPSVDRCGPSVAILRISLPMGISFNGHAGAIDWIQSRFKKSKPATLYYDEVRTPTYTDCLNPLLAAVLARREICGLYHAGGPRRLTLFQIAQIVNRVGGYDPHLLHGCMRIEAGPLPPRAGDVTMNSSKLARALGHDPFDPWPLDEGHVPTHREWHFEGGRGSPELLAEVLYRKPRRHHRPAVAMTTL